MSLNIFTTGSAPAPSRIPIRLTQVKQFEKTFKQCDQDTTLDVKLYLQSKELTPKPIREVTNSTISECIVQIVLTPATPIDLSIPYFAVVEVDEEYLSPYWETVAPMDVWDDLTDITEVTECNSSACIVQIVITPASPIDQSTPHFSAIEVDEERLHPYWEASMPINESEIFEDAEIIAGDIEQSDGKYVLGIHCFSDSESMQLKSMSFYGDLGIPKKEWANSVTVLNAPGEGDEEHVDIIDFIDNTVSSRSELIQIMSMSINTLLGQQG